MGCGTVKQNVIIQISYCGSCGWSQVAKNLCDKIQQKLPRALIDCRPQNSYTGVLQAILIVDKRQKKRIFKGSKQQANEKMDQIVQDIVTAYQTQ